MNAKRSDGHSPPPKKRCLSCGERIYGQTLMHPPCMKKVFDTTYMPEVIPDPEQIPEPIPLPDKRPFAIADVQRSLPFTFQRKQKILAAHGRKPDYNLKLPAPGIKGLTENQNICLGIATRLQVPVPEHTLVNLGDMGTALLLKRFDRVDGEKLRHKTFTQILEVEDKYNATLEAIGEKIKRISEIPGLDVQLFFEMVMLSFLLGHADLHLDTFSVLYDDRRLVRLAPLETLASTQLLGAHDGDFTLPMLGKTENITGRDFLAFSRHLGIYPKSYNKIFLRFFRGKRLIGRKINHSTLSNDDKIAFSDIVNERFRRLVQQD